jgi:hypothetical protein
VAAQIASGIDALNREAGQILHNFLPPAALRSGNSRSAPFPTKKITTLARIVLRPTCGVKRKRHKI